MVVLRCRAEEELEGSRVVTGSARSPIEEIGGGHKSIGPEGRGNGCLKQQCANAVVECAEHAFSTTILL
jgi:hypothetical protein